MYTYIQFPLILRNSAGYGLVMKAILYFIILMYVTHYFTKAIACKYQATAGNNSPITLTWLALVMIKVDHK